MTLYLKYRPQNLDELDSESVRESLKKIVSSTKIPHAFLFAGPKGTGKTSAARIVAKMLNCEAKKSPCDKCTQCLSIMKGSNIDVVELDAASHRGIDDVRILRDAVKLSPARARKKVYIIDEAHMLTTEASNALLKILEEPPNHVTFILATTNSDKLIDTIRSRSTEIVFNKAGAEEIKRSLARAIKGEKMKIDKETLDIIAERANGSFRDAVKILEQYSLEGASFFKKVQVIDANDFLQLLFKKDLKVLLESVHELGQSGVLIDDYIKKLLQNLQKLLIQKEEGREETIDLIELLLMALRQMVDSPIEELPLEIAVIKWCDSNQNVEGGMRNEMREENNEEKETPDSAFSAPNSNLDEGTWKTILAKIRPINASIEALLRASKPLGYDGKTLTLGVFYKFHKERLEDGHHKKVLEDVIAQVMGSQIKVICMLTEPPVKSEAVLTESQDKDIIKAAEEIFGV